MPKPIDQWVSPTAANGVSPRRQVMLDQEVQGHLLNRVVAYVFAVVVATAAAHTLAVSVFHPERNGLWAFAEVFLPGLGCLALGVPFLLADILRFSNRFVGPIFALRNGLKRLALGDSIPPLQVRRDDFWNDVLERVNDLLPQLAGNSNRRDEP